MKITSENEEHETVRRNEMAQRIATLRKAKGLSQQQLSDMTGCYQSQIARLEKGKAAQPSDLPTFCKVLDTSVGYLLFGHDKYADWPRSSRPLVRLIDSLSADEVRRWYALMLIVKDDDWRDSAPFKRLTEQELKEIRLTIAVLSDAL